MIHVAAFSGGKDSTALVLWLREREIPFTAVFCDTGWEHPITYAYIEEINQSLLGGKLVTLRSVKYAGMRELVIGKKRVPSIRARFCTDHLKVRPMIAYLRALEDEATVYQGIRAEESASRAAMGPRQWNEDYDAWVERPLFDWTAAQVLAYSRERGVPENPLYRMGAARVGCFPCVLISHRELKRLTVTLPEVWNRVEELERLSKRSFFPPNYIPERFCSRQDANGRKFPTAEDVRSYLQTRTDPELLAMQGDPPACLSVYNLCE